MIHGFHVYFRPTVAFLPGEAFRNGDPHPLGICQVSRCWCLRPHTAHVQGHRARGAHKPPPRLKQRPIAWQGPKKYGKFQKPWDKPPQSQSPLPCVDVLYCREGQRSGQPQNVGASLGACRVGGVGQGECYETSRLCSKFP